MLAAAATVTITGPAEVTGASFEVTVTFSEGVTGFTQGEVTVGTGSATGLTADSTTVYRVTIAPTAGFSGNVTVDVPAGVARSVSDSANNLAAPQFSTTATFASACATGSAVSDTTNTGLVADCAALLDARDTLRGTATLNWDANTSVSSWTGVFLGGVPQRVGVVNLSDMGLDGSIPVALSRLTVLTNLHLTNNQLSGAIPTELQNLANLTRLQLNTNQLTGGIPTELGNLANLTILHLAHNQLTGSIPRELANLSNLTGLYLLNNQLSGGIPRELGNLSDLIYLELDQNQLTGGIPTELGNLSNLATLNLHTNQLTGSIPEELGNLSNLTNLRLYENQLTGAIPKELGNLANLRILRLQENRLTGEVPAELGNLTALVNLYLQENQLTGNIPVELGNLTNLNALLLGDNRLTGSIPVELGNITGLRSLWLHNNQLSGGIPTELGMLTAIRYLLMNHNQLSGSIPTELSSLTSVQYLRLQCNQLTGTIPDSLSALTALVDADFRGNQITGGIPASMAALPVKLDEPVDCTRTPISPSGNGDAETDGEPRLTLSLTCPAGPLTEGDTFSCTLTLKNTGSEQLTNVLWWLPTLGSAPTMLDSDRPRAPPGELDPGRSISVQLNYGPLSPRRGLATLTVAQAFSNGATTQPTNVAMPWPAPLTLTVSADSDETDPVTVSHVVQVQDLTPQTLATSGNAWAASEDAAAVLDDVTVIESAGKPPRWLLQVELKRGKESANDGRSSTYTLTITNAGRAGWLTGLYWRSLTLRARGQVGDDGRLQPGETAVVHITPNRGAPANPTTLSVIVDSHQTGGVTVSYVPDAPYPFNGTPVGSIPPIASVDRGSPNVAAGSQDAILAATMAAPRGSPLQVELRVNDEPVAVGQNALYSLIITNTSRYWLLTDLYWQSPSLATGRQLVDDGTLRPGETVVLRLDYGPAHFRWQPPTLTTGRIFDGRDEPSRLVPLTLPWLAPLPLTVTVDGKLKVNEDEYRPVSSHASFVSALSSSPLTRQTAPAFDGQRASVGITAARAVRAVPAAAPLTVSFSDALIPRRPYSPMHRLLVEFLGVPAYLSPQIQAPAGMTADTASILTAYLVAVPPTPLEGVTFGASTAMLDMSPMTRIDRQLVKRREFHNGTVQTLVGHTVTVLSLLDAANGPITYLDKPLELRAFLFASLLPPGVTLADVYWARWDPNHQRWLPLPSRKDGRELIGDTQQPGTFAVIAETPPSRDLDTGMRYFYTTGKHLGFAFKEYFDAHGGVAGFGYPLTNEFQRNGATAQYFEKARFEFRPQFAGTPNAVALGPLGEELMVLLGTQQPREPAPSTALPPAVQFFSQTGHYLANGFLAYFTANGGEARFGLPVTGELYDPKLGRTVQYFQFQRLTWNAKASRVEETPDLARILILAGDPIR